MGLHGRNFFEPFSDDGSVSSFERRSVGIRMSKLKMLIENNCFVYIPFNESVMKINR